MPQAAPGGYAAMRRGGRAAAAAALASPQSTAKKERGMSSLSALNGPRIKVGARGRPGL